MKKWQEGKKYPTYYNQKDG